LRDFEPKEKAIVITNRKLHLYALTYSIVNWPIKHARLLICFHNFYYFPNFSIPSTTFGNQNVYFTHKASFWKRTYISSGHLCRL